MEGLTKASGFKRLGAAIIDVGLSYILMIISLQFIIQPIVYSATDYADKSMQVYDELIELGIAVIGQKVTEGDSYKIEVYADYNSSIEAKDEAKEKVLKEDDFSYCYIYETYLEISLDEYNQYLSHFYQEIGAFTTFEQAKAEYPELFVNGEIKDDADETQVKSFFDKLASNYTQEDKFYDYKDGEVANIIASLSEIYILMLVVSFLLSISILFILVPCLSKYRATLGKKILGLAVVDYKTGMIAKRLSVVLRSMIYAIFGLGLSLVFMGFPLFVVLGFVLINRDGRTIHDFIAKTIVVDTSYSEVLTDNINHGQKQKENSDVVDAEVVEKEIVE